MALTPKQQRFVEEYLVDLNATQAAIRAGYSARSAEVTGSRLLGNAKVRAVLDEAQAERSQRTQVTADAVVERLWMEATGAAFPDHTPASRVSALSALAKHVLGEKVDVTTGGDKLPALLQVAFVKATGGDADR